MEIVRTAPALQKSARVPERKSRRTRKRRRKNRAAFFCVLLCALIALAWTAVLGPNALKALVRSGAGIVSSVLPVDLGGAWEEDTRAALTLLAETHPEVQAMLDAPENWPADVAALAARNEEALDFVLAYPTLKDSAAADRVEEAAQGTFPSLRQWDTRWGCVKYGDSILAISGCGPTALSIVACGLTGDNTKTPAAVAAWAQLNGYAGAFGTSWELMDTGCAQFGLVGEELSLSEETVLRALADGRPIICAVRPGDFTTQGHFIVLTGVEDGKIRLIDPNSTLRSEMLWDLDRLIPQIKNLWAYRAA